MHKIADMPEDMKIRSDRRPLYVRAEEALAKLLAGFADGDRLPPEPDLARQMGISRSTLREAMRSFEEKGMIVRKQGVGTFVTGPHPVIETGLEVLQSIETLASAIGLEVRMGDLEITELSADETECAQFDVPLGSPLTKVERVILTDTQPVAYLVDILPSQFLRREELTDGFTGSVLDYLLRRGEPLLGTSRTQINAESAESSVARHLSIQRGDVLLRFEAWLYTAQGAVVDHSFSYFVPGFFRFHVIRRVTRGGVGQGSQRQEEGIGEQGERSGELGRVGGIDLGERAS